MMFLPRLRGWLGCLFLFLAATTWAEVPVPPLKSRVSDLTATLTAPQISALEQVLGDLESRTGSQLAVLLLPTTQPETIEQFSIRVVESWKLGHKGKDDGLLLVVAKNDRKVRIEVGYGLEGVIPDAVAKRIIDETISPRFKQGDFPGGLAAGVQALASVIEETCDAPAASDETGVNDDAIKNTTFTERLIEEVSTVPLWLLLLLVAFGTGLRWLLGPLFGGLAMAGVVGTGTWFVSEAIELGIFAGLAGFVFVLVGLSNWIAMGLEGVLSSGSGSRGGGGFSGGGGGFGGGGASGSW